VTQKRPPKKPVSSGGKTATDQKPPDLTVNFHPDKPGLEKFMGRLEAEVMKIIWTNGPMTVKRAVYFINKKYTYAYTTIMTVMTRLSEKGLLSREKQEQSYIYTPTTDEKQFIKLAAEKILAGLMDDYRSVTLNIFHRIRKASKKAGG